MKGSLKDDGSNCDKDSNDGETAPLIPQKTTAAAPSSGYGTATNNNQSTGHVLDGHASNDNDQATGGPKQETDRLRTPVPSAASSPRWHPASADSRNKDDESNQYFMSEPSMSDADCSFLQHRRAASPHQLYPLPPPPPMRPPAAMESPGNTSISSWESHHSRKHIFQVQFPHKTDPNDTPQRPGANTPPDFPRLPSFHSTSSASAAGHEQMEQFLSELRLKSHGALQVSSGQNISFDTASHDEGDHDDNRQPRGLHRRTSSMETTLHDNITPRTTSPDVDDTIVMTLSASEDEEDDKLDSLLLRDELTDDDTTNEQSRRSQEHHSNSADDEKTAERPPRLRPINRRGGHRRTRSGDAAAANLLKGGADWKGMEQDRIPLPPPPEEDDDEDDDDDNDLGNRRSKEEPDTKKSVVSAADGATFSVGVSEYGSPRKARRDSYGRLASPRINNSPRSRRGVMSPRLQFRDAFANVSPRNPSGSPWQMNALPGSRSNSSRDLMRDQRKTFLENAPQIPFPGSGSYQQRHLPTVPWIGDATVSQGGIEPQGRHPMMDAQRMHPAMDAQRMHPAVDAQRMHPVVDAQRMHPLTATESHDSTISSYSWHGNSRSQFSRHAMYGAGSSPRLTVQTGSQASLHRSDTEQGLQYTDKEESETPYSSTGSDSYSSEGCDPRTVSANRVQYAPSLEELSHAEELLESPTYRGRQQMVMRHRMPTTSFASTQPTPDRSYFKPRMSAIDDNPKAFPTFVCPNCKTRQREFFTVLNAPRQFESASGYLAIYCSVYVVSSLFIFGLEEGWPALDCIYFAVITVTTAGLGDLTPSTDFAKIICSIFIYFGVACIGLLLGSYIAGMLDDVSHREAKENRVKACPNCTRIQNSMAYQSRPKHHQTSRFWSPTEGGQGRSISPILSRSLRMPSPGYRSDYSTFEPDTKRFKQHNRQSPESEMSRIWPHNAELAPSQGSIGTPTPTSSQRGFPNPGSSPFTSNMLARQTHTRHQSFDFASLPPPPPRRNRGLSADVGFSAIPNPPTIQEGNTYDPNPPLPDFGAPAFKAGGEALPEFAEFASSESSTASSSSDEVDLFEPTKQRVKTAKYVILTLRQALFNSVVIIAIGSLGFAYFEGFSMIDSWYFATVLLTTVGYGDIVPVTREGKLFATVYLLVAGTMLLNNMSMISMIPLELRKRRIERAVLTQFGDHLDDEALRELATGPLVQRLQLSNRQANGLEECTREMFALAMLVRLGKVTEKDIRATFEAFRRLDVRKDGVLNSGSIIAGMIQRRRSVQNLADLNPSSSQSGQNRSRTSWFGNNGSTIESNSGGGNETPNGGPDETTAGSSDDSQFQGISV